MSVYDLEKEKEASTPNNDGGNQTADDIRGLEDSFGSKDADYPEGHPSKSKEQSAVDALAPKPPIKPPIEPADMYNPTAAVGKNVFSRFYASVGNNKKSIGIGGGIFGTIIIAVFVGLGAFLPFELIHIKEVTVQQLSGVQEQMLDKRRMRILSRAYFFRDNTFDGYKSRGSLFSFAENRKSTKIVNDLEARGFKVKPELDANGNFTGRFKSITFTNANGITGQINSSDSLWSRRSALRNAVNDAYPAKSALWRSKQTAKMYRRYGLIRGNWWTDNAATRKLATAEERMKKKIRDTLSGKTPPIGSVDALNEKDSNGDPIPDAQKANAAAGDLADGIDAATQAEIDAAANGVSTPDLVGDIKPSAFDVNPAKAVGESVFNVVKITGPIDTACQGISTANTIATVSRAQKAMQLAKYASLGLSLMDATKAGKADKGAINDFMTMANKPDPETGKSFFASAGWVMMSTKKPTIGKYSTTYNAGGGVTGEIQDVLNKFYAVTGGKDKTKAVCGTLANPFMQFGTATVGIVAAIFTGGGSVAAKLAPQAALEIGKQFLIGYATQLGVKAAAGTIVSGAEKGMRMGDAFSSGAGTMTAMNASARGFKPLSKSQFAAQNAEYIAYKNDQYNNLSIKDKVFNSDNQNTIAYKGMAGVATIQQKGIVSTLASIPTSLFKFGSLNVNAAEDVVACNDEDIVKYNIQTDGFCNPIMGQNDEELDKIDPIDNFVWMQDHGYVDGDGKALGEFDDYSKFCFNDGDGEAEKVSVLYNTDDQFVSDFTTKCFEQGAITSYVPAPKQETVATSGILSKFFTPQKATAASANTNVSIGLYERFRAFRLDKGIIDCTNDYLDQGYCSEDDGTDSGTPVGDTNNPTNSRFGPFVFPLGVTKETITSNKPHWCYTTKDKTCHGTEDFGYYASDIFVKEGVPVLSATDGVVVKIKPDASNKDGSATEAIITIKGNDCDDSGTKLTCIGKGTVFWYGHMKPNSQKVKEGDKVTAGQQIAVSGGPAQGDGSAHLHFDATNRRNDFRGACARETPDLCAALGFINIQPELYAAFNNIGTAATNRPSQGWVWPLANDLKNGNCWNVVVGSLGHHAGMDINTDNISASNPALAAHDGTVARKGFDTYAGNYITIKSTDGIYYSYEHLSKILVSANQQVKAGDPVGIVGKTGRVTASSAGHLHFVTAKTNTLGAYSSGPQSTTVDPMDYLPASAPNNYSCIK